MLVLACHPGRTAPPALPPHTPVLACRPGAPLLLPPTGGSSEGGSLFPGGGSAGVWPRDDDDDVGASPALRERAATPPTTPGPPLPPPVPSGCRGTGGVVPELVGRAVPGPEGERGGGRLALGDEGTRTGPPPLCALPPPPPDPTAAVPPERAVALLLEGAVALLDGAEAPLLEGAVMRAGPAASVVVVVLAAWPPGWPGTVEAAAWAGAAAVAVCSSSSRRHWSMRARSVSGGSRAGCSLVLNARSWASMERSLHVCVWGGGGQACVRKCV